jgi:cytochrome c oxidase accessory protein FixG
MTEEKYNFRDRLATIDEKGKRVWVYAKKPKGKLTTSRTILGVFLLLLFFTGPFLKINGEPLLLLNFIERRFILFGIQFWPQDFHLFFLAMISLMVFIILFTVTYGRLFCGWACPQTIFMEMIFRKIEYWIEGDAYQQKELEKKPWNFEKIWKKSLKHIIFYLISLLITNFFFMYIIGFDEWKVFYQEGISVNLLGFIGMIAFAGVFYFIFSWFREQVCSIVCPYGRLQGVLLDRNSIIISYDYKRGEPRGPLSKSEDRNLAGKGDCVNCLACVQVCPTGIDIRNGTQLECINCACCIDACDAVMKKVGFRPRLIKYASETMIAERQKFKLSVRTIAYSMVLIVLLGVITIALASRTAIEATVLRAPGMLFQDQGGGKISNLYNIKLVNKTNSAIPVDVKLVSMPGEIKIIGDKINVDKQSVGESVFFIILDQSQIKSEEMKVQIGIYSGDKMIEKTEATFFGPKR